VTKTGWRVCREGVAILSALVMFMSTGCNYGRMNDQDSKRTYEEEMPLMDKRTIPVKDGFEALSKAEPELLRNPFPYSNSTVAQGKLAYGYFCIQCHGPNLDGNGTVGQSFVPVPTNLVSPTTLSQADGEIYSKIRLGFGRHPTLYATVSSDDTWAVIVYIRSKGSSR
jgi:mono/diheme cytochrome c family protein